MALLASAAGKAIVKSPAEEVLLEPKSRITTALLLFEVLWINAPRAVMVEDDHVTSAKSVKAVVPEVEGVTLVKAAPAAV